MPIFEYHCSRCERNFEKLVFGSEAEAEITCPGCRSPEVEKLFSGFCGRTKSAGGQTKSMSSGCAGCHASSCAGCK